jgi:hypothetical protein
MRHYQKHIGSADQELYPAQSLPIILRTEVLKTLDAGEVFDITFCTADRRKGTGGEIIEVKGWMKITGEQMASSGSQIIRKKAADLKKDPEHWKHKTVNIRDSRNPNRVRKVHARLIGFFNGKRVVQ